MSPTSSINSSANLNGGCFDTSYGASNSSWRTTMHPIVVGTHKLYPLSIEMEQRLILHYLIPTCEYQDVNNLFLLNNALCFFLDLPLCHILFHQFFINLCSKIKR